MLYKGNFTLILFLNESDLCGALKLVSLGMCRAYVYLQLECNHALTCACLYFPSCNQFPLLFTFTYRPMRYPSRSVCRPPQHRQSQYRLKLCYVRPLCCPRVYFATRVPLSSNIYSPLIFTLLQTVFSSTLSLRHWATWTCTFPRSTVVMW